MGKDPHSASTDVTGENEPVVTNELEGIALKANPARSPGRQAASSGKDFKKTSKQTKPLRLLRVGVPHSPARSW